MDGWTVAWLMWIAIFFAIEIPALMNKREGDTLSELVRKWFATGNMPEGVPMPKWYKIRRLILIFFLAWLNIHWLLPDFV